MNYAVGIDVGSTQTKAVALDTARAVVARALIDTGANVKRAGQRALDALIETAGIARGDVKFVVGTGYGRYKIEAGDTQVTEISCHARGAHLLFPGTRTVIDMGGQDTKAIKIGPEGDVLDFCMNDKCAAGTGRFLAGAAEVLGLKLDEIGGISLRGRNPIRLTSVCTVFVESDILSSCRKTRRLKDILAGVHEAIATRTVGLVRRVGIEPQITFTGGVASQRRHGEGPRGKARHGTQRRSRGPFSARTRGSSFAMDHVLAAYQPTVAVGRRTRGLGRRMRQAPVSVFRSASCGLQPARRRAATPLGSPHAPIGTMQAATGNRPSDRREAGFTRATAVSKRIVCAVRTDTVRERAGRTANAFRSETRRRFS